MQPRAVGSRLGISRDVSVFCCFLPTINRQLPTVHKKNPRRSNSPIASSWDTGLAGSSRYSKVVDSVYQIWPSCQGVELGQLGFLRRYPIRQAAARERKLRVRLQSDDAGPFGDQQIIGCQARVPKRVVFCDEKSTRRRIISKPPDPRFRHAHRRDGLRR